MARHIRGARASKPTFGVVARLVGGGCPRHIRLARHRASGFGLECPRPDTDGVVTGWGTIDGRKVFVYAHDFRIFGGSLGEVFASKIHTLMDLAAATGAPIIGLNDGGGARIQEGITALAGFGGIFARNVSLSGVRLGNVADAIRQYRTYERLLDEELGVQPTRELTAMLAAG